MTWDEYKEYKNKKLVLNINGIRFLVGTIIGHSLTGGMLKIQYYNSKGKEEGIGWPYIGNVEIQEYYEEKQNER